MSSAEFESTLSFKRRNSTASGTAKSQSKVGSLRVGVAQSLSWLNAGIVTDPKNQGSCGACWTFVAAAQYESYLAQKGEGLLDLSEEYILECTNEHFGYTVYDDMSDCVGGFIDDSIKLVQETGMPSEASYPYLASGYVGTGFPTSDNICSSTKTQASTAPDYQEDNYGSTLTSTVLQQMLQFGPVSVAIYAPSSLSAYSSGVFSACPSDSGNYINHAVLVIGYESNGDWIIKNSWGTDWGQSGYAVISNDQDCGLSLFAYQLYDPLESFPEDLIGLENGIPDTDEADLSPVYVVPLLALVALLI